MNYLALKIIHLTGLSLAFMGLAGVLAMKMAEVAPLKQRWVFHLAHGLGLLLLIVSGVIMIHQLEKFSDAPAWPGWVKAKLGIWLLAGAAMGLAVRLGGGRFASLILVVFAALVAAAAWLAICKPF